MSCLSSSLIPSDSRKELATRSRASSGHGCQGREEKIQSGNKHRRCKDRLRTLIGTGSMIELQYISFHSWLYNTWNQSMVQQLMRDGNWRRRVRKASPMGLKATTMCRFSLQRDTKNANRARGLNSNFLFPASARGRSVWRKGDEEREQVSSIKYKWIAPLLFKGYYNLPR